MKVLGNIYKVKVGRVEVILQSPPRCSVCEHRLERHITTYTPIDNELITKCRWQTCSCSEPLEF